MTPRMLRAGGERWTGFSWTFWPVDLLVGLVDWSGCNYTSWRTVRYLLVSAERSSWGGFGYWQYWWRTSHVLCVCVCVCILWSWHFHTSAPHQRIFLALRASSTTSISEHDSAEILWATSWHVCSHIHTHIVKKCGWRFLFWLSWAIYVFVCMIFVFHVAFCFKNLIYSLLHLKEFQVWCY